MMAVTKRTSLSGIRSTSNATSLLESADDDADDDDEADVKSSPPPPPLPPCPPPPFLGSGASLGSGWAGGRSFTAKQGPSKCFTLEMCMTTKEEEVDDGVAVDITAPAVAAAAAAAGAAVSAAVSAALDAPAAAAAAAEVVAALVFDNAREAAETTGRV
jgi:hypothetical protein